jgi:hypothetical protein
LEHLVFRAHALRQMWRRGIDIEEVRDALRAGAAIEEYPDERPYSSRLVLGWSQGRPIHVVAAEGPDETIIVVTVYEPAREQWEPDFRTRKRP